MPNLMYANKVGAKDLLSTAGLWGSVYLGAYRGYVGKTSAQIETVFCGSSYGFGF